MNQNSRQTSVLAGALVSAVIVPPIGAGLIVPALPAIARALVLRLVDRQINRGEGLVNQ